MSMKMKRRRKRTRLRGRCCHVVSLWWSLNLEQCEFCYCLYKPSWCDKHGHAAAHFNQFLKKCDTPHMTKKTKTALIVVTYSITNTHEFVSMNVEHVYLLWLSSLPSILWKNWSKLEMHQYLAFFSGRGRVLIFTLIWALVDSAKGYLLIHTS